GMNETEGQTNASSVSENPVQRLTKVPIPSVRTKPPVTEFPIGPHKLHGAGGVLHLRKGTSQVGEGERLIGDGRFRLGLVQLHKVISHFDVCLLQIGRASCRERVSISTNAVSLEKKSHVDTVTTVTK